MVGSLNNEVGFLVDDGADVVGSIVTVGFGLVVGTSLSKHRGGRV